MLRVQRGLWRVSMASPLCTICEKWGDSEGVLCCEEFPSGVSKARYPWGCNFFMAKPGMEEIARSCQRRTALAPELSLPPR